MIKNNLIGTFHITREVANQWMIKHGGGRIVNVIANIYRGFPGMVHTGAARAGVENMTMTLAVEWAPFGIRVNAVAPGIIRSSGTSQYPPQLLERGIAETPLKRAGTCEEVAAAIVFLASPGAQSSPAPRFASMAHRRCGVAAGARLMDLGLAGKACLVVGASRGIGRAIALQLAREGARVAAIARGAEGLASVTRRARRSRRWAARDDRRGCHDSVGRARCGRQQRGRTRWHRCRDRERRQVIRAQLGAECRRQRGADRRRPRALARHERVERRAHRVARVASPGREPRRADVHLVGVGPRSRRRARLQRREGRRDRDGQGARTRLRAARRARQRGRARLESCSPAAAGTAGSTRTLRASRT